MKPIRVDFEKNEVIMTRKFAAAAADPHTVEYRMLQDVLNTYKGIQIKRHTIKKNPKKETYKGLTYEYMRDFIRYREDEEMCEVVLAEMDEMIRISECHSKGKRYPKIKEWFLQKYADVELFGATEEEIMKIREKRAKRAEEAKKAAAEMKVVKLVNADEQQSA